MNLIRDEVVDDYNAFIQHFVDEPSCLCEEYAYCMSRHFPELVMVYGESHVLLGDDFYTYDCHVWCEDQHGRIIDPTAHQYTEILSYHSKPGAWPAPTLFRDLEKFYRDRCKEAGITPHDFDPT